MAKLDWNAAGERFFESGVDQGVLFVGVYGVAWTGLVSVTESADGGDPKPFYIDGYKYLNISAAEEFTATIEAYSAPPEFGPCDGSVSIHNGLFATQQPRKPFNFSYRTRVGNDVDGADHGYKIHLVYNALAAPSERSNATLGDSVDPTRLSWSVTTLAPKANGLKPTAHFIVDSRYTPTNTLLNFESLLYGSQQSNAQMPDVPTLLALFNG